jgi:hypothetical protein
VLERALNAIGDFWLRHGLPGKMIYRARDGELGEEPYLFRIHLLWTPWFGVFLHRFMASDAEGLHDHPFSFVTVPLTHGYLEDTLVGTHDRKPWRARFASAEIFHRVILRPGTEGRVWTLFIRGRFKKRWGFLGHGVEETYELWPGYASRVFAGEGA